MKFSEFVTGFLQLAWSPYFFLVLFLLPLFPVLVAVFLWLAYENYKEKKHQEMAIAANMVNPGTYCDECFSKLAGNTAEHPHTYACSHSKQLMFVGKRSHL